MVELYTGEELIRKITVRNLENISELLNKAWGSHVTADPRILFGRMQSDDNIFVGYLQHEDGLEEVCSVLETRKIRYNSPIIPADATYNRLTANGTWGNHPYTEGEHEILILVDVAAKGKGNGRRTIEAAKEYLAFQTSYDHVLTFTPDIEKVRQWHESCGATRTNFAVEYARPGYHPVQELPKTDNPENVRAMSYTRAIAKLREIK